LLQLIWSLFLVISDTFSIACFAMEMEVSYLSLINNLDTDVSSHLAGEASGARKGPQTARWTNLRDRGRIASYPTAPSQTPACGITAPGYPFTAFLQQPTFLKVLQLLPFVLERFSAVPEQPSSRQLPHPWDSFLFYPWWPQAQAHLLR